MDLESAINVYTYTYMYADGICVMALTTIAQQKLFDICYEI